MAWHPLTRLLVVLAPIAIAGSYLLQPDDPTAVPAIVRAGDAQAAVPVNEPAAGPPPALMAAPELTTLTETVERPLFSATRRGPAPPPAVEEAPPVEAVAAPPPALTVQGLILAGNQSIAMLRRDDTGEILTAHPGDDLSGWHVDSIAAGSVTLRGPDGPVELPLFQPPSPPP
jgi:general secretion pathway protein N